MKKLLSKLAIVIALPTLVLSSLVPLLLPNIAHAAPGGYAASDEIGQLDGSGNPDFTTNVDGFSSPSATNLSFPSGVAIDTLHHRLFVNDGENDRVLVYNLDADNNLIDHTADYALGQPDFTSNTRHTTQNGVYFPYIGITYDSKHDRLFVADEGNNRVLVFDLSSGITNGMNAAYVLGQPDFTAGTVGTTQNGFNGDFAVTYDSTKDFLFVDDFHNSRVLVFDLSGGITNGMNASYVLGQPDFTSNIQNATQDGMDRPETVAYNATTHQLFVGDSGNSRVLVYDLSGGITNGMNAAYVLGQPDFTSHTATTTQNGLGFWEEGLVVNPATNTLYVGDDSNNRIMIYDLSGGMTNGMNANMVLGQPDFTTAAASTTQTGINDPEGVIALDPSNNRLYVPDSSNNRVLIYDLTKITPANPPNPVGGQAYSQKVFNVTQAQGTVTYTLSSGTLPDGLVLGASTGLLSGTPTKPGAYNFSIKVVDDNGAIGSYTYTSSFAFTIAPGTPDTGLAFITAHPLGSLIGAMVAAGAVVKVNRRVSRR